MKPSASIVGSLLLHYAAFAAAIQRACGMSEPSQDQACLPVFRRRSRSFRGKRRAAAGRPDDHRRRREENVRRLPDTADHGLRARDSGRGRRRFRPADPMPDRRAERRLRAGFGEFQAPADYAFEQRL
ncbi:MAG: hypothetical protein BJ554DRAFT_3624 [Olpidium bornovanus]|uniref:Uncharacterized protein n=1 Tax=Olpidium bornovanus TaxID=278681 RepID=A0A8H8A0N3_9FUNG|nr:MAG: hypothetical protein BJ554DRAFT_3624 [Olpidium bornovanus]